MCKVELTSYQIYKKAKGICTTPYCTEKLKVKGNFCFNCQKKRQKENDPFGYAYNTLKHNAKRRGKEFTLTLEQFIDFATFTFYMDKRGKHHNGLHIDRIDESKGYHYDNIQIKTNSDNVKKYNASRKALSEAPF